MLAVAGIKWTMKQHCWPLSKPAFPGAHSRGHKEGTPSLHLSLS